MGAITRRTVTPVLAALVTTALVTTALVAGSAGAATGPTLTLAPGWPGAIPAQYQALYQRVSAQVQSFSGVAGPPSSGSSTATGIELLAANGNIGPGLLRPTALSGVEAELDAFQALGVGGVTVDVSFPLLLSSTPNSQGYLHFYEEVASQIRRRHLVFSVEENPIFSGTPLTTLPISYAGLTLSSYAAEDRQEAQAIIDHLAPDYLSILTEPDTYTDTLHVPLDTPAGSVAVVADALKGLSRHHTKVGAGTGTWSSSAIDTALVAHTSIDYLDVHMYPFGPAEVANLKTDVTTAKKAHLPLVMDETWLNKPTAGAGDGPASAPESLKVKSFSFWGPLDESYVTEMLNYVRSQRFAYVAFFDGARAFFGYLPWSTALEAASYQSFSQQYNQLVGADMRTLTVTGTGLAFAKALGGS